MNHTATFKLLNLKPTIAGWKWVILVATYSFLIYKLLAFTQYAELWYKLKFMPLSQFSWLFAVMVLLPLNWILESFKWKMITNYIQQISLKFSIKAVLAGISTGFFTPNRVGELIGRIMYLNPENQKAGVTLSFLNSLTQNLIITLCGIPALIIFFSSTGKLKSNFLVYIIVLAVCFIGFAVFYFLLPKLSYWFKQSSYSLKIKEFTNCLSEFNKLDLILIMLISLVRYCVFCVQFFFMLKFFGVELSSWQALIAIPGTYLLVTFTPSMAFSEAAIRSTYSVLIIGVFSPQTVSIALAGMCIWMLNFVVPMMVGSFFVLKKE